MNAPRPHPSRQRGAALLLGLLLLSLLSLLVTQAWSDNQWHLRVASHELSRLRAEAAARSALNWAERWLLSRPGDRRPIPCDRGCRGAGVLSRGVLPGTPGRLGEAWWLDHGHADGFDPDSGTYDASRVVAGTPTGRWLIEEVHLAPAGGAPDTVYYRITARAARAPRGAPVMVESILARPWGETAWSDSDPNPGDGGVSVAAPRDGGAATSPAGGVRSFCRRPGAPTPCGRLAWRRVE